MLQPLRRLRRVWLRLPRQVMWIQKTNAVQVTSAALASLATTHPELSFVCFGNAQACLHGNAAHAAQPRLSPHRVVGAQNAMKAWIGRSLGECSVGQLHAAALLNTCGTG